MKLNEILEIFVCEKSCIFYAACEFAFLLSSLIVAVTFTIQH